MKNDDVEVTEIVELQATKVSGVGRPANGTPFLLLKAAAESDDEEGIPDEVQDKIDAKDDAKKSDSPEADAQQDEMTEEAAKERDAKKSDVQDALDGTRAPEEAGHLATGQSQTSGAVTDGTRAARSDASYTLGGETTAAIPDSAKVDYESPIPASTDAAGAMSGQTVSIAKAVSDLVGAMDLLTAQRAAVKDGKYLQVSSTPVDAPDVPLTEVASTLAGCVRTLEQHLLCERVEAAVNPGEQSDVWDMEDAKCALESALRLVANIAIMESLEEGVEKSGDDIGVAKAYKRLTVTDTGALRTARDRLSAVIEGAEAHAAKNKASSSGEDAEKEIIHMADVTKGELAEAIVAGVDAAFEARKAAKKEKAEKRAAEEAEKNANNGGDVSEADIKPTKETDSDDINAVKGEDEEHELDPATKQLHDELTSAQKELQGRLDGIETTLAKIAKRPRAGGPSLDGHARGASPAAEGRLSDATKASDGGEIEMLQKQLDEATDPATKSELGLRLTRARLTAAHEAGRL